MSTLLEAGASPVLRYYNAAEHPALAEEARQCLAAVVRQEDVVRLTEAYLTSPSNPFNSSR